jgi:hypothetical protein
MSCLGQFLNVFDTRNFVPSDASVLIFVIIAISFLGDLIFCKFVYKVSDCSLTKPQLFCLCHFHLFLHRTIADEPC